MFIVVLLSVGNNLATLPQRTANHKFKWQFMVLLEEEFMDFEPELRASEKKSDANNGRSKAIVS